PKLPFILYRGPVSLADDRDPAAVFEELFARNGWRGSWRNGIYDYLHYHSRTHEGLGVARGPARVRFGGARGKALYTKAAAMWWCCRQEPATSDSPPAGTCWWWAHTHPSAGTTNAVPARPTTIAPLPRSPRSRFLARTRYTDVTARSRVFGAGPSASGAIA